MNRLRNALGIAVLALTTACSSGPVAEPPEPSPTASPTPAVVLEPPNDIVISDAVPTLEELRALGIAEQAAECFIETIDPDSTGVVQSADLFMEAFGACL